ncbi:MAG: family 20 glycosylhydrolase [Acidobacteriota bacterium]
MTAPSDGKVPEVDPRLLVPPPQEAIVRPGRWRPEGAVPIGPLDSERTARLDARLDALAKEIAALGCHLEHSQDPIQGVRLNVVGADSPSRYEEAYRLVISPAGVDLTAHTVAGLFRGLTTLAQWLRLHPPGCDGVVGLEITDWPDLRTRGLLLDISRNRVPKMGELYALVDLMSELKFNQLQLYVEHTFAYVGHETVWRNASPIRPDEIRRLGSYARRRAIELVPTQNSFGHFHRWLVHEPYRRLAECPDGVEHPFSPEPEPFSLCPLDPGVFSLLDDLYGQLLPHVPGQLLNVGLDETLDLGLGRSREACETLGTGRVYLDFLRQVHRLAANHGRRILFWADVALAEPELLPEFPKDALAMVWGYEADHDFKVPLQKLGDAGLKAYVCPGTGAWNSFTGRTATGLANAARAAVAGEDAAGYLLTDWGDHGHLQPPAVSWPAYVAGAAFAWNRTSAADAESLPVAALLDRHVLHDPSGVAGRVLVELGEAQAAAGVSARNGGPLFFAWMFAAKSAAERRGVGFTAQGLDAAQTRLADTVGALKHSAIGRADGDTIRAELAWAADAAHLGAELARIRLKVGEDVPLGDLGSGDRRRLRSRLEALVEALPPVWRRRSRPGGLSASIELLKRPAAAFGDEP